MRHRSKGRKQPTALEDLVATQPVDVPFEEFTRAEWTALGAPAESRLSPTDVATLAATGDPASLDEVADVYVPLAQLLAVYSSALQESRRRVDGFLRRPTRDSPFVIGVAGSVAVGKSTTARLLRAVLQDGPGHPPVELITTDGFLYPNAELDARGLIDRKGFPESYDRRRMIEVLSAVKAGRTRVKIPVYSHVTYDIVPGEFQTVESPAMVIVEGLNVLQVSTTDVPPDQLVASDFFDFSIYVDADEADIARWFTDRLLELRQSVLRDPHSYFHAFAGMSTDEVSAIARTIWSEVNLVNLHENIAPTAGRANLVLEKDGEHRVRRARLRKI
jgi:type I pantothenate kinase